VSTNNQIAKQARRIADAIVDLVERTDGPVTLAGIHRQIPGFAENGALPCEYVVEHDDEEIVIWAGMTKAGYQALRKVMSKRRVAVQFVRRSLYALEPQPRSENWRPLVLLPARSANLDTPRWLIRCSQRGRDFCIAAAAQNGKSGYRALTPAPMRYTVDQFCPGS
jgi:hypothetical protein